MSIADILTWAVKLYKRDFWYYIKVVCVVFIPTVILSSAIVFIAGFPDLNGNFLELLWWLVVYYLTSGMIYLIGFMIAGAASIKSIEGKLFGREMKIGEVLRETIRRIIPLFLTTLLIGLMSAFGLVMCFVAIIVLGLFLMFVPQAIMLDNRYYFKAIDTSFKLVTKSFLTVAVIAVTYVALIGFISQFVTMIVYIVPLIEEIMKSIEGGGFNLPDYMNVLSPANSILLYVIQIALVAIVQVFFFPLQNISFTLCYYNMKNIQDGAELTQRIRALKTGNANPKP